MARRPGPSFRALLFRSGEGAVCEPSRLEDRQLRELVFLSVQKATLGTGGRGPQARSVLQGPAVSVWRRRRLWAVAAEDRQLRELVFLSVQKATLGTGGRGPQAWSVLQGAAVSVWRRRRLWAFAAGRQTAQRASFLVGSESNVRHWGPWPAGPVRPSDKDVHRRETAKSSVIICDHLWLYHFQDKQAKSSKPRWSGPKCQVLRLTRYRRDPSPIFRCVHQDWAQPRGSAAGGGAL